MILQNQKSTWYDQLKLALFDTDGLEIMKKAIVWYGIKNQLNKCKEECIELSTAIENYNEPAPGYIHRSNTKAVADELADVFITAIQATKIIGVDAVIERINFKLSRLDDRIEGQITVKNERIQ